MACLPALLVLVFAAPPEPEEPATPTEISDPEPEPESGEWRGGAMIDIAYGVNPNFPKNHVNRGAATAPRTGEIALNYIAGYVFHEPTPQSPFRFQLSLHAGANVDATYAGEPSGSFVGTETFKHIGHANVGVVAPWGRKRHFGTETGAGLYSSPITVGSYWSYQSWNYTSSWGNSATPYYLMGAHVTQELGSKVNLSAWVVNGWQIIGESNQAPSYMASLVIEPVDGLTLGQNTYFGPEHADTSVRAWRFHSDTQLVFDRERGGVAMYADYGRERRTDLPGQPSHQWAGGALLGRVRVYEFTRAIWEMGLRPEVWWESDGTFFGATEPLLSASYVNSLALFGYVTARVEYRLDHSLDRDGFFYIGDVSQDAPRLAQTQHVVFFSLVGYFERRFGGKAREAK